jgi:hypothetical protein
MSQGVTDLMRGVFIVLLQSGQALEVVCLIETRYAEIHNAKRSASPLCRALTPRWHYGSIPGTARRVVSGAGPAGRFWRRVAH